MKKFLTGLIILFWIFSLLAIFFSFSKGSSFVQSRGSILCLSCMGLEENEDL